MIEKIKAAVKDATGICFEEFTLPGRKRERYFARLIFVRYLQLNTRIHYKKIAKMVNRNSSTVCKYDDFYLNEKKVNPEFKKMSDKVESYLNGMSVSR